MSQSRPPGAPEFAPRARALIVLRATDVRFVRAADDLVTPFSFALEPGQTHDLRQATPYAASLAARLCAAIVKPTTGTIVANDFETRLQAPEAKRRIGFVDRHGFDGDAHAFRCEVAFHADVWGLETDAAQRRARDLLAALDVPSAQGTAYARAIALALVADVSALVLDAAPDDAVGRVRALVPRVAIVRTRAS